MKAGADGACLALRDLGSGDSARSAAREAIALLSDRPAAAAAPEARAEEEELAAPAPAEAAASAPSAAAAAKRLLSASVQSLVSEQKSYMEKTVKLLEDIAPGLDEARAHGASHSTAQALTFASLRGEQAEGPRVH